VSLSWRCRRATRGGAGPSSTAGAVAGGPPRRDRCDHRKFGAAAAGTGAEQLSASLGRMLSAAEHRSVATYPCSRSLRVSWRSEVRTVAVLPPSRSHRRRASSQTPSACPSARARPMRSSPCQPTWRSVATSSSCPFSPAVRRTRVSALAEQSMSSTGTAARSISSAEDSSARRTSPSRIRGTSRPPSCSQAVSQGLAVRPHTRCRPGVAGCGRMAPRTPGRGLRRLRIGEADDRLAQTSAGPRWGARRGAMPVAAPRRGARSPRLSAPLSGPASQ
jgi:hypothetical protein